MYICTVHVCVFTSTHTCTGLFQNPVYRLSESSNDSGFVAHDDMSDATTTLHRTASVVTSPAPRSRLPRHFSPSKRRPLRRGAMRMTAPRRARIESSDSAQVLDDRHCPMVDIEAVGGGDSSGEHVTNLVALSEYDIELDAEWEIARDRCCVALASFDKTLLIT